MSRQQPRIQLIIPVFNEAECIDTNLRRIIAEAASPAGEYRLEVLVIDDGSQDGTADILRAMCKTLPDLACLEFTRNFGKEAAIQAGFEHAAKCAADAVILLDSDLQHPPSLVPHMVALWQAGAALVEAIKVDRGRESLLTRAFASIFYGLFRHMARLDLRNQSDFKLLDRSVLMRYLTLPERQRFFRGLVQWMGYPAARIPFEVPAREHGNSKWSRLKLLRYALDNITTFSAWPLRFILWAGLFSLVVGGIFGSITLYQKFQGEAVSGFTTVILLLTFFGGLLMLSLGVIGHYLARIHDEIKGRPPYVLREAADPSDPAP